MNKMVKQYLQFALLTCCLCLGLNSAAFAQETTGTILGTVRDPNGAVVPSAQVTVSSAERGFERGYTTNDNGVFSAPLLPPGVYKITVNASGFSSASVENVQIAVNDRRPLEINLGVAGGTATVNVTDEPTVIQESPTQQAVIQGTQARQLPLNNRNFTQLVTLAPGVTSTNPAQIGFGGLSVVQFSINGGRTSSINWLVDGARNVDTGSNLTLLTVPSVDAIQEFSVLTSNYAPEFGRNGGGVVNLVTRQGSNDFHGTLYEFVRNDVFNARDPTITAPLAGLGSSSDPRFKQPLRYNDFGGTIGGPVFFPRFGEGGPVLYNGRNKTFFFFSQEFRRIRATSAPNGAVATNAQRNGVFATAITDPLTGRPFPGNTIPASRFNANSVALLNFIQPPNEGTNLFRRVTPVAGNFRQSIIRFDHNFTDTTTLTLRYIRDDFSRNDPGGNPFLDPFTLTQAGGTLFPNVAAQETNTPGDNFVASLKFGLSPRIINEIAYDFARNKIQTTFVGTGLRANAPGFTSPELFPSTLQGALPSISIANLSGLSFTSPQNIENPSHTVRDNLTWVLGNHTLKFGAFVSHEAKNENAGNALNGSFTFDGTRTGNAFGDFLLGLPASYFEDQNEVQVQLRYNTYELYAQDSWKVSPRLTIDYGARYSLFPNPIDENNLLASFLPSNYDRSRQVQLTASGNNLVQNAQGAVIGDRFNGIIFAGQNSPYGRRVQSNQYNTIGPRVGFAYNVFGDGSTIVRGGFGVYYDRTLVGIVEQNAFVNPLVNSRVTIDNSATAPLSINDPRGGAARTTIPVIALITTGDEFKPPQTLQYSLALQRELLKNTVLEVAYVGTQGRNLLRQVNINQPLPRFARNGGTLPRNFYRPFIGYGNINERRTDANSNYNSAQVTLTRRFANGFQFGAVYTFSKNITESSTDRSDTIQNPLRPSTLR